MAEEWEIVAERGPEKDTRWVIRGGATRVGRGEENDILLTDFEVSREHLVIERTPEGTLTLLVLPEATNETLLNEATTDRGVRIGIAKGDCIAVGETVLRVCERKRSSLRPTLRLSEESEHLGRARASRPMTEIPVALDSAGDWRFASLARVVESLAEAESVGALYELALEHMHDTLRPDRSFIADYVDDGDVFRRVYGRARTGAELDTRMSRELLDSARREKIALLFQRKREADFTRSKSYQEIGIRDFMCVPFFTGRKQEVFEGICYFDVTTQERPYFTEEDLEFAAAAVQIFSRYLEALRLRTELVEENEKLKQSFSTDHSLIGSSPVLQEVMRKVDRYAPKDSPVLIAGETGTGKELIARAIARRSPRCNRPFVAFNCGAIPGNLVEAELFGAEKGAFTGCDRQMKGKLELADSGILFLDEIGELPLEIQPAFLRVLEGQEFYRLGGQKPLRVNVRLLAATHRDLEELVAEKRFRADLFYRIAVLRLAVPPLRDREGDVLELAEAFLQKSGTGKQLSKRAEELLKKHHWPGNVRELFNTMERAIVNCSGKAISPDDLDLLIDKNYEGFRLRLPSLAEVEKRHIELVLDRLEWNLTKTAAVLGINRQTVYDKLERYGLKKPASR